MASRVCAISDGGLDQHLTLADGSSTHSSWRGAEAGTVVSPTPAFFYQNGFVVCAETAVFITYLKVLTWIDNKKSKY